MWSQPERTRSCSWLRMHTTQEVLVGHEQVAKLSQPEHERTLWPCRSQQAEGDVDVVSVRVYEKLLVAANAQRTRRCW